MAKKNITGVIVTGAAGFLGSHLCEHFVSSGIPCIGLDNFSTGTKANVDFLKTLGKGKKFAFAKFDVCEDWKKTVPPLVSKLKMKVSHVFHFASPASPPLYQELAFATMAVNTRGLKRCIDFADTKKARVIFASTSETYGDPLIHPQPESYRGNVNTMGPRACYDEAKRYGETIIYTCNWKNGTNHGLVRIFNTYGPRMNINDGRVVINFLAQAERGQAMTIYGDGQQTRSFCFVSDLLNGILKYAESDLVEPVNLGNDKEFTILELAETVAELFGKKPKLEYKPLPKDDPVKRRPDLTKAKKLLTPWEPKIPLKDGLKAMLQWLKEEHA
jgi:nucleoside-diphosphate-sugar epimerase